MLSFGTATHQIQPQKMSSGKLSTFFWICLAHGSRGFGHLTDLTIRIQWNMGAHVGFAVRRTDVGSSLFFRTRRRENFSHKRRGPSHLCHSDKWYILFGAGLDRNCASAPSWALSWCPSVTVAHIVAKLAQREYCWIIFGHHDAHVRAQFVDVHLRFLADLHDSTRCLDGSHFLRGLFSFHQL